MLPGSRLRQASGERVGVMSAVAGGRGRAEATVSARGAACVASAAGRQVDVEGWARASMARPVDSARAMKKRKGSRYMVAAYVCRQFEASFVPRIYLPELVEAESWVGSGTLYGRRLVSAGGHRAGVPAAARTGTSPVLR